MQESNRAALTMSCWLAAHVAVFAAEVKQRFAFMNFRFFYLR